MRDKKRKKGGMMVTDKSASGPDPQQATTKPYGSHFHGTVFHQFPELAHEMEFLHKHTSTDLQIFSCIILQVSALFEPIKNLQICKQEVFLPYTFTVGTVLNSKRGFVCFLEDSLSLISGVQS